jgi:hypothetical protein
MATGSELTFLGQPRNSDELDNDVVCMINQHSYHEMVKEKKEDTTQQCEVAWSKKITCELLKHGIEKQGDNGMCVKCRKFMKITTPLNFWDDRTKKKENEETNDNDEFKLAAIVGVAMDVFHPKVKHFST